MDKQSTNQKSNLLEFNDNKNFMKQLLITDQAKKSVTKPIITSEDTNLNLNLLSDIKKFLEDTKKTKSDKDDQLINKSDEDNQLINNLNDQLNNLDADNDDQLNNLEEDSGDELKNNLGVEFDLLMYKEDENSSEESSSDED